jgi:two-component system, NarL family, nitrate/nitrite response regulator NarL
MLENPNESTSAPTPGVVEEAHSADRIIRLLLVDDHVLFRASLARFLASETRFRVVSECASFANALELLQSPDIDIVLLDLELGSEQTSDFMLAARQAGYTGRFLLIAGTADARSAAIALKLGASGIFMKSDAPERLVRAIRLVASGDLWVDPKVIQMLAEQLVDRYLKFEDRGLNGDLEERERNVLLGILSGLTNKKIGASMGLSESSVKNIVQRLFGRAGVKTRSQLVRVALEGSLVPPQPHAARH